MDGLWFIGYVSLRQIIQLVIIIRSNQTLHHAGKNTTFNIHTCHNIIVCVALHVCHAIMVIMNNI
jgi:hypothetical protein